MNNVQAEEIFKKEFAKHVAPKCGGIETSGQCHEIRLFQREISGSVNDEQIKAFIAEAAADVAAFEQKQLDAVVAWLADQRRHWEATKVLTRDELDMLFAIDRKSIKIVRRHPPHIVRTSTPKGDLAWCVSARVGTRIEPYPKKDPRSARVQAFLNAKIQEDEQEKKKPSQLLLEQP